MKRLLFLFLTLFLVSACEKERSKSSVEFDFMRPLNTAPNFAIGEPAIVEPCSVDEVDGISSRGGDIVIKKSEAILAGWAANVPQGTSPHETWIRFSGAKNFYIQSMVKEQRQDVVDFFQKQGLLESGWRAFVDLRDVSAGSYKLNILMRDASGYAFCDPKRLIRVE